MQSDVSKDDRSVDLNGSAPRSNLSWQAASDHEGMLAAGSSLDGAVPLDEGVEALEQLRAVVIELYNALRSTLEGKRESARQYIESATRYLRSEREEASEVTLTMPAGQRPKPIRGGLAPWQIRRVKTHVESNLDATIRIQELAGLVKLSSFHFCRAFRDSFGDSPHGYVMRRRIERAQGLMLTTDVSLGQIAADCGLADQAHFNKLFRRFVGESPGTWRRARAVAPK